MRDKSKKQNSRVTIEQKIITAVNTISVILFVFSGIGLGISVFLKHIHLIVVSLLSLVTFAYLTKKARIIKKKGQNQKD